MMVRKVEFLLGFRGSCSHLAFTRLQRMDVTIAHQPSEAWSFLAEARPLHEVW